MKKHLCLLTASLLCFSCLASGCNNAKGSNETHETNVQSPGSDISEAINQTEYTDLPETSSQTVDSPTSTKLAPEFVETGAIVSRFAEKPLTVEIGNTGVTIDLDYISWPTVTVDENGKLYAAGSLRCEHVDPFGATAFTESTDGGATWSDPRIIYNSPIDDRDAGLVYIGEGKMVLTFFTIEAQSFLESGAYATSWGKCTDEQKAAKIAEWNSYTPEELSKFHGRFVITSSDYGKTWSDPINVPFSSPHGPSLMKDGKTLIASGVSSGVFSTYTSSDYGNTWKKSSTVTLPPLPEKYSYSEPHVIQLSDGSFLAGIRSEKSGAVGTSYSIYSMKSKDGKTWSTAKAIPTVIGAPAHFLELSDGTVLLTYSYRVGVRGIRGCVSYDGGETWATEKFVISNNTSKNNRDLGYPSTVQMADGTLITVYYQPYGNDYPTSLLYTKWKLTYAD